MTAALYLHSLLSLKLDARDAYKLAHDYRAEELHKAADELERTADEVEAIVAAHYGPESGIGPGSAEMLRMAGRQVRDMAGKDTGGALQAPAGESTQPTGPFERVTVYLTPATSAALVRAVETIGDSKTDTINRAIQTYALMAGEVADGSRVLVQRTDKPTQPAPDECSCMPHRKFPCGHCEMDVCQDCGRCCSCTCGQESDSEDDAVYADVPDESSTPSVQASVDKLRRLFAGGCMPAAEYTATRGEPGSDLS